MESFHNLVQICDFATVYSSIKSLQKEKILVLTTMQALNGDFSQYDFQNPENNR